jgi:TorA maturation chaperone TorD
MLQISALLDIQHWLVQDTAARSNDQKKLHDHLSVLEANQTQLVDILGQ